MATVHIPSQTEDRWLECKLDKGMFSDEMAVTYPPQGDTQKSVFVERSAVRGTAGEVGKVRVRLIRRQGQMMAVLPSPEQDIVYVHEKDISEE